MSTPVKDPDVPGPELKRAAQFSAIASAIEWYDLALYGQAAALVFGQLFFPKLSPLAGTLAAFGTFALGFGARPLGAIIFGHLGDKVGRKPVLIATLLLMGLSSGVIGLLPTYGTIGIAAPVLLVLFRIFEGLGVGAEYAGAVTLVAEHAPPRKRGLWASIPAAGVFIGIGLAAAATAIVSSLPREALMSWGWRLPFLVSFAAAIGSLLITRKMAESDTFNKIKGEQHGRIPLKEAFARQPGRLLLGIGANLPLAFNIYVAQTYVLAYLKGIGVASTAGLTGLLIAAGGAGLTIPLAGWMADRYGRKPVYLGAAAFSAIMSYPFFWMLDTRNTVLICVGMFLLFSVALCMMFGAQGAMFAEIYQPHVRYTAIGVAREFPAAALGAPAPIIATLLVSAMGGSPSLVSLLMLVVSVICFGSVAALPETRPALSASLLAQGGRRRHLIGD
jgi:MHS family shikimate/dehydroshikimate transporter-like MFS transporter